MSVRVFFYSVMDALAARHLPAHELRLPAHMAHQDRSPHPSQRVENRINRGVGYIEPSFTEDTVHFHINDFIGARILRNFPAGSVLLPVLCHCFLRNALHGQEHRIENSPPG